MAHSNETVAWFCLRSQPRHEHIAAAHVRQIGDTEVFLPRVRFKRATRQGTVWVTEALFPGYIFARFNWQTSLRQVKHASGVSGIVHFGEHLPVIPDATIEELRRSIGTDELHTISAELAPGDAVQIAEGPLRGLRAVVSRVMPGRERIAVLMDLLGRQTTIEVTAGDMVREGNERTAVFQDRGKPAPGPE
jgi:transcription elongation factor/antiterminator RfaH